MKGKRYVGSGVAAVLVFVLMSGLTLAQAPASTPLGTAFTYQGQLKSSALPYTGTCDIMFGLYDALTGGTQVGILTMTNLAVDEGFFTVQLDYGTGKFAGDARWLEMSVRCPAGSGTYQLLTPRQALTAAPYALYSRAAPWSGLSAVPAGFADGTDNDTTYSAGTGLTLSGTTFSANTTYLQRRVTGTCDTGNAIRVIAADGTVTCQAVGGGGDAWLLTGNTGTTPGTNYLGTIDNQALELRVNGARALRLEPNATSPNVIGGHAGNWVTAGVDGATIGGGGSASYVNRVTDAGGTVGGGANNQAGDNQGTVEDNRYATVGGGMNNKAYAEASTIAGGYENGVSGWWGTICGGQFNMATGNAFVGGGQLNWAQAEHATIGGGSYNFIEGGGHATIGGGEANHVSDGYATIGGGAYNTVNSELATVGGGEGNTAYGPYSTVPGGAENRAGGFYSFAAGRHAWSTADGCFVWGDSTDADVTCDNANRWVARASGGVYFYTNAGLTSGVYVAAGGGAWASVSDRKLKENVAEVDTQALLASLAQVPVTTWSYKSQDASIRHIGPMAQDFYAAFGVGEDDTHITTVDADGVALAAIQGLYAENQALKAENAGQQAQIDDLGARLTALEAGSQAAQPQSRVPALWLLAGGLVVAGGTLAARRRPGGGR